MNLLIIDTETTGLDPYGRLTTVKADGDLTACSVPEPSAFPLFLCNGHKTSHGQQ